MSEEKNFLRELLQGLASATEDRRSSREHRCAKDLYDLANAVPKCAFMTAVHNSNSVKSAYIDAILGGTQDKATYLAMLKEFDECVAEARKAITNNRTVYKQWLKQQEEESEEDSE